MNFCHLVVFSFFCSLLYLVFLDFYPSKILLRRSEPHFAQCKVMVVMVLSIQSELATVFVVVVFTIFLIALHSGQNSRINRFFPRCRCFFICLTLRCFFDQPFVGFVDHFRKLSQNQIVG